jgi:hypothetical protein
MKPCADNKSTIYKDAADCLIEELILNPLLVGTKHREKLADLVDNFKDEYGEFTSKHRRFFSDNIWIVASKPGMQGFHWHVKYSFDITEVVGKLACVCVCVLSSGYGGSFLITRFQSLDLSAR